MKNLKLFTLLFLISASALFAQGPDFAKKFSDAEYHLQYKNYTEALPLYVELANADANNANVSYKAGFCYLMSAGDKSRAIPYLEKAVANTSKNYEEMSASEKRAPEIAIYDLATAYQINMQFDKAEEQFAKYKGLVGTKNKELATEIDRHIAMCQFAAASVKKPVNVTIKSLGANVNTKYPEYEAFLTPDESSLIFNSKREGFGNYQDVDGSYFESALVSYEKDGNWAAPVLLSANINVDENDAVVGISADGSKILCWKSEKLNGNIYLSEAKGESWNTPIELGANINSKAMERGACITPDGNTIFFVSDRKGGLGGTDIYRSEKGADGVWGPAVNLGNTINTPYDEVAPVISIDGKTLYFASNGHETMGGLDIVMAPYNSGDKTFGTVTNLGFPINSPDDETSYYPTMNGKYAYYSATRKEGMGDLDLYMITFNDKQLAPMTVFTGKVINNIDAEATVFPTIVATVTQMGGSGSSKTYNGNYNTGKVKFPMLPGAKYSVKVEVDGVEKYKEDFDLTAANKYEEVNRDIYMKAIGETPEQKAAREAAEQAAAVAAADAKAKAQAEADKIAAEEKAKEEAWKKDPKNKGKEYKGGKKDPNTLPEAPAEFRTYFKYNKTAIDATNKDFMQFMKQLTAMVKAGQSVTVVIEASASKVPTTKFGTNDALAAKRGADAKAKIISMLKAKGADVSKVTFAPISALVGGPEYNKDFNENRAEYEKSQYVDISVK
jgi:Tol biopolymer transport system component